MKKRKIQKMMEIVAICTGLGTKIYLANGKIEVKSTRILRKNAGDEVSIGSGYPWILRVRGQPEHKRNVEILIIGKIVGEDCKVFIEGAGKLFINGKQFRNGDIVFHERKKGKYFHKKDAKREITKRTPRPRPSMPSQKELEEKFAKEVEKESYWYKEIYGINDKEETRFLSIIVAVKNRGGARARNFFRSLAVQTDKKFELIIIDYGSNEPHQKEYKKFQEKFKFRYYYIDAEPWNRARALNIGIGKASGDYIMTTDIDMIFAPHFIKTVRKAMNMKRMVWTRPIFLNKRFSSTRMDKLVLPRDYELLHTYAIGKKIGAARGTIQCTSLAWFLKVHGYDERMIGYSPMDWDMWHRAKRDGLRMHQITPRICAHQWHKRSPEFRKHGSGRKFRGLVADRIVKGEPIKRDFKEIETAKLKRRYSRLDLAVPQTSKKKILVTIVMPVVSRPKVARKTITALMKYANFPYIFKVIIHPDLKGLIKWARQKGLTVIPKFIFPMPLMKYTSTQLCETKYLLMLDVDMLVIQNLKPMLDFMEKNPDVGVCAPVLIRKERPRPLSWGANISVEKAIFKMKRFNHPPTGPRYCNYVHNACTFMRMKIFEEVNYDTKYKGQGHAHEDFFLQLSKTKWKCVVYPISVRDMITQTPHWYKKVRKKGVGANLVRLKRKWGIKRGIK